MNGCTIREYEQWLFSPITRTEAAELAREEAKWAALGIPIAQ